MYYDVRTELVLSDNALWQPVEPDRAENKNGEIALKLRRLYTYASKYALTLQFLKMSLRFGNSWDHLSYVLRRTSLEFRFSVKFVSFDKCQKCGM